MVVTQRQVERGRRRISRYLRKLTSEFKRETGKPDPVYKRVYQYVMGYGMVSFELASDPDTVDGGGGGGEYIPNGLGEEYIVYPEDAGITSESGEGE